MQNSDCLSMSCLERIGREREGGILYVKKSLQVFELQLGNNATHGEAIWCKVVSPNSVVTISITYHKPNITKEDNEKTENA